MLLAELVAVSGAVAATRSRSAKIALVAGCLRSAHAGQAASELSDPIGDEVEIAAAFLSGELRQRRTGVGWAALRDARDPPGQHIPPSDPTLTLTAVDAAFARIAADSGPGSQARRGAELAVLFAAATEPERALLIALVGGELRQGAQDGVMVEAIAAAAEVPVVDVRRAFMLRGSLPPIAAGALRDGVEALRAIGLEVGRPVLPMLAQSAPDVATALAQSSQGGPVALEWKLDGIRVQLHRAGDEVRVFSRTLDDITTRVPELVEAVGALAVRDVVLDGEAIALDDAGRPRPFQETAARTSSRLDVSALRASVPVALFVFDVLHHDGRDLLEAPAADRQRVLEAVLPEHLRVPRIVTADPEEAARFFADAIAHGHEGVVVKSVQAPYEAGRRGAGWVKVKPRHTLDLVVLAVEWGHGRRAGVLSNLHLGARDGNGGFVMLGKTFKGLTDELLAWQTELFLRLETHRDGYTVYVAPEAVVEIAFDGVQTSPRYPGGVALRFARVLRYRPDKRASDADDLDAVRAIHGGATAP
ncbi:MAG TPA: ATP-dependent DNA ligase [Acidothermaceae bacterium]|nr:ATP-dependent DNA ligase [Acidothermaceae bacterium]